MSIEDDLVAVTPDLLVEDLIMAYDNGVFPWPIEGQDDVVPWFSPQQRGVLFFKELHISRSLKRLLNKQKFHVSFCKDFERVLKNCATAKRPDGQGTWINEKIKTSYAELFKQKRAYSVEVWNSQNELVGGLYGVLAKTYVSGESMFFHESGASKVALVALVERLENLGLSYLDTQMTTPHLKAFGGREVSKNQFMKMVKQSTLLEDDFFDKLSS